MLLDILLRAALMQLELFRREKGVKLLRHPVGNKRLGVAVGMNAVILHPLRFQIYLFHKKTVTEEYRTLWRA